MKKQTNKRTTSSEKLIYIPLNDESSVFTTYDLGLSTALLCTGFTLLSVDKENPQKVLFIFQKTYQIEDIANLYLSNGLEVKARSFFDNLKAIKTKIYS